jgi:hypothetical protein
MKLTSAIPKFNFKTRYKQMTDLENVLSKEKIAEGGFDAFSKIICDQDLIANIGQKLERSGIVEINTRTLLSALMINFYPEFVIRNKDGDDFPQELSANLEEDAKKLTDLFYEWMSSSFIRTEGICVAYENFQKSFDVWRKRDKFIIIEKMTHSFWEIEMTLHFSRDKIGETDYLDLKKKSEIQQTKITEIIQKIGGIDGYQYFMSFVPVIPNFDESFQKEICIQFHRAYWDLLADELNQNNYSMLKDVIKDVRERLCNILPSNITWKNDIKESVDEEFICHKLKHDVMSKNDIHTFLQYLIDRLEELQPVSFDSGSKKERLDLDEKFKKLDRLREPKEVRAETVRIISSFFEHFLRIFDVIEKLCQQIRSTNVN